MAFTPSHTGSRRRQRMAHLSSCRDFGLLVTPGMELLAEAFGSQLVQSVGKIDCPDRPALESLAIQRQAALSGRPRRIPGSLGRGGGHYTRAHEPGALTEPQLFQIAVSRVWWPGVRCFGAVEGGPLAGNVGQYDLLASEPLDLQQIARDRVIWSIRG